MGEGSGATVVPKELLLDKIAEKYFRSTVLHALFNLNGQTFRT